MGESLSNRKSSQRRSEVSGRLTAAIVLWLHAAEVQRDRAMDSSADRSRRIADAVFFTIAIRNVRLAVHRLVQLDAAPGYGDAILAIFDEAVPSINDLRHALEYYDEYVLGIGRAQKKGRLSDWTFGLDDENGDSILRLGELSLNIPRAYAAALKAFQQMFVVLQKVLTWPEHLQGLP